MMRAKLSARQIMTKEAFENAISEAAYLLFLSAARSTTLQTVKPWALPSLEVASTSASLMPTLVCCTKLPAPQCLVYPSMHPSMHHMRKPM